jgi:FtsP/CotA-like multicopper oxidase with cupredoxin domain
MNINRRIFLKSVMGTALGAAMAPGVALDVLAQQNKTLREFRFSASRARVNLGVGQDFVAWTYNGQIPGPEIRVKEGEIIRVVLRNYLPEGTTIHWHGIPLSNAMDGVPGITQPAVMPGETFVYEFEAKPAGSFIYHSHAKYQLDQGLYGPLIIEPSRPNESYDREYTLMLEDWVLQDSGGAARTQRRPAMGGMHGMMHRGGSFDTAEGPLAEPVYDDYAVNGKIFPAVDPIRVRKGDKVKLRIANPSAATIYYLRLAGHVVTITHADGNPIKPIETDVLRIGMGERYDVMFVADNPGHWLLAAAEQGFGEGRLRVPVFYEGVRQQNAVAPDFRTALRMATYRDFEAANPSSYGAAGDARFYDQVLSGGMHSPYWTINGRIYPDADNLMVKKGGRVRLRYGNHSMMPHPMHLHGHFFKIVNPALPRQRWVAKDTLVVEHMERIEVEFEADNPGNWFHHCHNLYHMEAGMANVIRYQQTT